MKHVIPLVKPARRHFFSAQGYERGHPQTIFIVGRAYHKAKNYPRAAVYYLAAAQRGISEGRRIVQRHLSAGYITKTDFESAQQESGRLFH